MVMKREALEELFKPLHPTRAGNKMLAESPEADALTLLCSRFASTVIDVYLGMPGSLKTKNDFLNHAWKAFVIGVGAFDEHVIKASVFVEKATIPDIAEGKEITSD